MKRRTIVANVVISLSVVGLLIGICGIVGYRYSHYGEGPKHSFVLVGDAQLTDEQALRLSKDVMISDQRYSSTLQLMEFGSQKSNVNRGDDRMFTSVGWNDPASRKQWFVQLHREYGRVTGISYPGR